jgi:phosphopantetheine--protein transferase-like protein
MKRTNAIITTANDKDTLFLESDWISIPELNSPVLIVLKTDQIGPEEFGRMKSFLSGQEITKSHRFRFSDDRKSYIVVHGFLRWMLGRHLGIPPEAIEFTCGLYGKPSVSGYFRKMFFNLSHSSGVSVFAFDPDYEIGVDVERINEEFEYEPIVKQFFTQNEGQYILDSGVVSNKRFYEIWTRKEAYLKAVGAGITKGLDVEVLKEKINGNSFLENGTGRMDFLFRTMIYDLHFQIALAMDIDSPGIHAYVIKKTGNRLPINKFL